MAVYPPRNPVPMKDFVKDSDKLTIAIDFDGVIHSYEKGWHDGTIYGKPMPGAKEFLHSLIQEGHTILIHSTRLHDRQVFGSWSENQVRQVIKWWDEYRMPLVQFWTSPGKPLAHVYIDDRAIHFNGCWNKVVDTIANRFPGKFNIRSFEFTVEELKPTTAPRPAPEEGVRALLTHLGEDPDRDGLKDTPARVVRALTEMTQGYKQNPAEILSRQFELTHDEMVVLRNVSFVSLCEHHMLPFQGKATVGYVPGQKVVGLSKLARLVQCFSQRLQVQERLTDQIATSLMTHLQCPGAGVVIKATHSCMSCRGVKLADSEMVTSSLKGIFREDPRTRSEFLSFANKE
jgi:GTP cyclohydrolase I